MASSVRVIVICSMLGWCTAASATVFRGIDFAGGERSFVDAVLLYEPSFGGGLVPTSGPFGDPASSIGAPDYPVSSDPSTTGSISLGDGGRIILEFRDNILKNSGDSSADVFVFEVGPQREDTLVSLRPTPSSLLQLDPSGDTDGDRFFEVGRATGGVGGIDIDQFFTGDLAFDAIQLVDDPNQGPKTGTSVGADIDAVGAFISAAVPEPGAFALLAAAITSIVAARR